MSHDFEITAVFSVSLQLPTKWLISLTQKLKRVRYLIQSISCKHQITEILCPQDEVELNEKERKKLKKVKATADSSEDEEDGNYCVMFSLFGLK